MTAFEGNPRLARGCGTGRWGKARWPHFTVIFIGLWWGFSKTVIASEARGDIAEKPPPRAPLRISLDLYEAEVTHVVRLLADAADRNVVIPDDVEGRVTLKLTQVEWGAALRMVLATRDLGVVEEGNVLRIAPRAQLAREEKQRFDQLEHEEARRPLSTRTLRVSHARAVDLVPLVKPTLSNRGTVSVDIRTNTLIIRDVAEARHEPAVENAESASSP